MTAFLRAYNLTPTSNKKIDFRS